MLGIILRNVRKMRGLTQSQLGKKLSLAENTISNYETEHSNPNFDIIYKFLGVCDFELQVVDKKTKKVYNIKEISKEMDF